MAEKKLGYNIRIKAEKVNVEVKNEYLEMAKRADDAGVYYLAFPEFFGRFDPSRIHVVPYMAAVAARTEHVKLGTDILQIPLLHPKHIADIGSSLDIISEGRFILGAGTGWVPAEFENFGIPFKERGKRTDEGLDIIKKLWTEPAIYDYRGKFFTLRNVCSPPCVQKPHPPIWVGGASDAALRRTAQYGNEWVPAWWMPGMAEAGDMEAKAAPGEKLSWTTHGLKKGFTWESALQKLREYCTKYKRELVLGRAPRTPKEVGFNMRINVNINPDREKALEEVSHFWVDVRKGRSQGVASLETKLRYQPLEMRRK